VIEADEYDYMFLGLQPYLAIVTNIEYDHPDCFPSPEDFYQAFVQFVGQVMPGGALLVNTDDAGGRHLMQEIQAKGLTVFSYGLQEDKSGRFGYQAQNLKVNEAGGMYWDVVCTQSDGTVLRQGVSMQVPGEHNVSNALAVLAAIHRLGLSVEQAAQALGQYQGTGRRFEVVGEAAGIVVIDDYAHHPTQIRTTLSAARQRYPGRRLCAVWQPHTYSRIRHLAADFSQSFGLADVVVVSEVYASRENRPEDGFGVENVMSLMQHPGKHFIPGLEAIAQFLSENLHSGDVLLVLSAGDADQISQHVLEALKRMEASHA
jgi:UDP-N-acetylmuramate--alanine ligase